MAIFINPGTEAKDGHKADNAVIVAKELAKIFRKDYPNLKLKRDTSRDDNDGWYGFTLVNGGTTIEVDIPGDDPEEVMKGEPWVSRRLYVDGSSWLWGYAIGIVSDRLKDPTQS